MKRYIVSDQMGLNVIPTLGFLTKDDALEVAQLLTRMTNMVYSVTLIEKVAETTVIVVPFVGNRN